MLRHYFSSLAVVSLVVVGCSSDPVAPVAAVEAGTDAPVDSGTDTRMPPKDTGPMAIACQESVEEVECTAPTKAVGKTTCTDAMLAELAEKCIAADPAASTSLKVSVPAACAEWKAAYAECATCVKAWSWSPTINGPPGDIYPDDYFCYWSTMDASCATSVNCMFECEYTACGNCEDAQERRDCFDGVGTAGGACYDLASKNGNACFETYKAKLANCSVDEMYGESPNVDTLKMEVVRFLRGACRDNADWTNAGSPLDGGVPDSGSDTGSDSGSDTSATDAADAD